MSKVFYTTFTFEPSSVKYGWKYGGHAKSIVSNYKNGEGKIKFTQFGNTQKDAEEKLLSFISIDGKIETECVGESFDNL
jgi:hypothetical protein